MNDTSLNAWIAAFPQKEAMPFELQPPRLYGVADLYDTYDPVTSGSWNGTYDQKAYRWFMESSTKKPRPLTLAQAIAARLHDAAIQSSIDAFLGSSTKKVVGFMGGHDARRGDPAYRQIASLARDLQLRGLQVVSGGGPGLMEAANLGAFLAGFNDPGELDRCIADLCGNDIISDDPSKWINAAIKVRTRLLGHWKAPEPERSRNLGIPTWLYGYEPPNLFSTVIGKYFYNSVREDGLVTVANGGLVFGEGNAGTVQEIFQDAVLNYYRQHGTRSTPMIFLGQQFWNPAQHDPREPFDFRSHPKPVYPLIQKLARDGKFGEALLLTDDHNEVFKFIQATDAGERTTLADMRLASLQSVTDP